MFAESDDGDRGPLAGDLQQRLAKRLAVGRGHDEPRQTGGVATDLDVVEHVVVDVGVLGELGLGEHRVAHVAQRIDPWPHDIGAARGHVGEHRGLRLDRSSARGGPQCFGLGQQPSTDRVETRPMRRGRASADDRPEAHVHVRGVPHQQDAPRRRLAGDDLADPGGVRAHRRPSARTRTNSVTVRPRRRRDPQTWSWAGPARSGCRRSGDDVGLRRVLVLQQFPDPLGVVGVVGGDVQHAVVDEFLGHGRERARLQEPAFVMPGFGPRVGKKTRMPRRLLGLDQLVEHHHRVPADHAHVLQPAAVDEAD